MEALLFMLNSIAIVLMVFMGLRDDRRPPGAPHTSLFRMRDEPAEALTKSHGGAAVAPGPAEGPSWADWERPGSSAP